MNYEFVEEILQVGNLFCEIETKLRVTSCFLRVASCFLRVPILEKQFHEFYELRVFFL